MTDYPAKFRMPLYAPLPIELAGGVSRVKFDSGDHRQRRFRFGLPRVYQATFTMLRADFDAWSLWVNENAYDWFYMPLDDCSLMLVRFITDLDVQLISPDMLSVTVSIEAGNSVKTEASITWILAHIPSAPSAEWVIAGTPPIPAADYVIPR